MKKIIILIFLLLILTSCGAKKEDFYNVTLEDKTIAVGYDKVDLLDNLHINSYKTYIDKKDNEILDYIEFYVKDLSNENVYIDDYQTKSIKNTCNDLGGEIVSNNGDACVLYKQVKDNNNIIILHGNILADDTDKIDRIEIIYEIKED